MSAGVVGLWGVLLWGADGEVWDHPGSLHADLQYFVGNMGKASIPWIGVCRKLVLVTKLLCVVSLLFRGACLVVAGMDVVRANRAIKTCAYLSIVPAVSGMQQLTAHSKETRM